MQFKKTTLSDLSIDNKGSYGIAAPAVAFSNELYAYLRITDITDDGKLNRASLMSVDDINSSKYLLRPNDIVFARTGGSTGRNYFYDGKDGELVYAGFLIKFSIDKEKVNPKFVKYYCQSDVYKNWVNSFNTGSTRGNINAQTYGNMEILLPPQKQQDFLVEILETLNDKIDLNIKINNNLEQQAQAIFKSWFVDFEPFGGTMPSDWKYGKLQDIANITMGQSPAGTSYNEIGNGSIFFQGRAEFGFRFPTKRLYTTEPKRFAKNNDVLMSVRAPVGDINIALEDCCIGRGLAAINAKKFSSFVLYTLFNLKKELNVFNGEGTVFGSINKDSLNSLNVLIPNEDTIFKFETVVSKLDSIIRNNCLENKRLSGLRDTLLPKLMSGEIDVEKVRI